MSFCSPEFGLPMSFFLSPSSWTFPLRQGRSSSLLSLPGLLRSDLGGLSVSSPSGEREDACGLRRWHKFPALEFYSASFLHWMSSLSYPYFTTLYILNKRIIKQLFPDPHQRRPRFEFPGSAGAGPRQGSDECGGTKGTVLCIPPPCASLVPMVASSHDPKQVWGCVHMCLHAP